MEPYLISLYSQTNGCSRFFESAKLLNAERVEVKFDTYPGHKQKWASLPRNLDKNRHAIFLDTDDVIVQKDLGELVEDIYLGTESIKHKDTLWKEVIAQAGGDELLDETIYNVGSFAMRVDILYKFVDFLMSGEINHDFADQLCFNLFLKRNPQYSKVIDLKRFCPLFANIYVSGVVKSDGWRIGGELISVIHGNGDSGNYL
jgi:hypothetical protein